MNAGPSCFRAGTVSRNRAASASSVLGGKNSNEMVGSGRAYSSEMRKRAYLLLGGLSGLPRKMYGGPEDAARLAPRLLAAPFSSVNSSPKGARRQAPAG